MGHRGSTLGLHREPACQGWVPNWGELLPELPEQQRWQEDDGYKSPCFGTFWALSRQMQSQSQPDASWHRPDWKQGFCSQHCGQGTMLKMSTVFPLSPVTDRVPGMLNAAHHGNGPPVFGIRAKTKEQCPTGLQSLLQTHVGWIPPCCMPCPRMQYPFVITILILAGTDGVLHGAGMMQRFGFRRKTLLITQ